MQEAIDMAKGGIEVLNNNSDDPDIQNLINTFFENNPYKVGRVKGTSTRKSAAKIPYQTALNMQLTVVRPSYICQSELV
jgi:hypothetical protein